MSTFWLIINGMFWFTFIIVFICYLIKLGGRD